MKKVITVQELKKIIVPGSECCFLMDDGDTIDISVTGNNIIKMNGSVFGWSMVIMTISAYEKCRLVMSPDKHFEFEKGVLIKESGWGGRRLATSGKKIGRPKTGQKKKPVSVSLSLDDIEKLDSLCQSSGLSRSAVISRLLS